MVKTFLLAVAVCGETLASDKRRRAPEPVSALQIRAEKSSAEKSAAGPIVAVVGQCKDTAAQRKSAASFNPDAGGNWECPDTKTSGSFNATAAGLNNVKDCAQFVEEKCDTKAVFISFHPGLVGNREQPTAGDCAWFSSSHCTCAEGGAQAKCEDSPLLTTQYTTAKISDLFAPQEAAGTGVAPLQDGTHPVDSKSLDVDQTVILKEAENTLVSFKNEAPEAAELMTIPSATEIDMDMLHEDPSRLFAEMRKNGATEAISAGGKPVCPDDTVAASRRGEWMCLAKNESKGSMYVFCLSFGMCAICFLGTHFVGRRIRKGNKSDDEEEHGEEEEEAEEEDFPPE